MALKETINKMNCLLETLTKDLEKVIRGNKAASQRVRVFSIRLEKTAKLFRKESVAAEKKGIFKKMKAEKKVMKKPVKKAIKIKKKKKR